MVPPCGPFEFFNMDKNVCGRAPIEVPAVQPKNAGVWVGLDPLSYFVTSSEQKLRQILLKGNFRYRILNDGRVMML